MAITKQMSRQVSCGSGGDYQADEQAGVARLSWGQSSRRAGRCHAVQLAIIKQMNRQVSVAQLGTIKQRSRQVSRGSGGEYQADEQAGVEQLRWRISGRRAGRCRTAQLAYIKQMSRQVSRCSVFVYQADEQARLPRLS